jgi:hypothetical protein
MKRNIIQNTFWTAALLLFLLSGCSDSWMEPKPLSFYTSENVYIDAEGFDAALAACESYMRAEFTGDGKPSLTEMILSDISVEGTTDKAGPQMDIDKSLLPDANLNSTDYTRVGWYWQYGYKVISIANVVISRINDVEFSNAAERDRILGQALFHRAYWYFKLVHQFGDVPFNDGEIAEPKTDFYSHDRWSILERLKTDLEFAYNSVPDNVDRGRVSRSACGVLLMKINICLGHYDAAIQIGQSIVSIHPLVTQRFNYNLVQPVTNLMYDLHSVETKSDMRNTEGLMYVVSYPNVTGSTRSQLGRDLIPRIVGVTTPDGLTGVLFTDIVEPQYEIGHVYGRGIGRARSTNYYQYTIWTEKERNDIRGVYDRNSWKSPADMWYNAPALKNSGNPWYGQNLVKNPAMSVEDSIRSWYQWPVYKVFVPDPTQAYANQWGGETSLYIYRSAEVYLLMAEAYYWKDQPSEAASMLNVVRKRAGADELTALDVNIGAILDERARELYAEENRKSEITRIAFTYAKTGKACEYFGGRTYRLDNISGPGGINSNIKQEGVNFYWDWVNLKNNFYNKGVSHRWAEYKLSVHHILWPVPVSAINANTKGVINQNIGYPGAENNVLTLKVPAK